MIMMIIIIIPQELLPPLLHRAVCAAGIGERKKL